MNDQISLDIAINEEQSGRQERSDAIKNRRRLRQTAADLFAAQGVANVNMAEIAKTACVGKGTLYRHFGNKGEVCLSLLDEELRLFQDRTLAELRTMTAEEKSVVAQLHHFIEQLVRFVDLNLELMVEIDRAKTPGAVQDVNQPHFWQTMTISGLLQKGIRSGELRPNMDVEYVTRALLAPLDARILRPHRRVFGYSTARISSGLKLLVDGLRL